MATFLAGARLTAQTLNDAFTDSASDTQNTLGTTTATSYTATLTGGTACGVAFVAPSSGIMLATWGCLLENSGTARSYMTIRVRTGSSIGSGSDVVAAIDDNAVSVAGAAGDDISAARILRITGLTPGQSYNIQTLFRVTGTTGTFVSKHLTIQPVAA